jgi:hypothetical protein
MAYITSNIYHYNIFKKSMNRIIMSQIPKKREILPSKKIASWICQNIDFRKVEWGQGGDSYYDSQFLFL